MSFVDLNITYVFDMKYFTPNKAPRVTMWNFDADRQPSNLVYTDSKGFLIGQKLGSIATYTDYYDADYVSGGSYTNNSYTSSFRSVWIDLGDSVVASLLKRLKFVIEGGSGANLGIKWYKDFNPTPSKITTMMLNPTTTGVTALWGGSSALYGTSKFTPVYALKEYNASLTGSAKHIQIEMDIESNGKVASLQDLTLLHKQGKIR
jgi:hypothetical protein